MSLSDEQQMRATAAIAASNIMGHHDIVGGASGWMLDRLEEVAEVIYNYIEEGVRHGLEDDGA